jgi:hypothetical protein
MDMQFKLGEPAVAAAPVGRTRYRGPLALAFAASVAVSGGASLLYPAKSLTPTVMGLLLVVAELEAVFWTLCALSMVGTSALLWKDLGARRAPSL